jgi:hypothetical protein
MEEIINSLLLIVKDLTGLGPVVFPFALEGFSRKKIGVLLVGLLDLFSALWRIV